MCLILTLVVGADIYRTVYADAGQALRYAAFQVVSIVTTTGYATADYELWPGMSQIIIFLCMFVGASAGSTGGGMKCLRIMLCFKYCYKELFSMIHPRAVTRIKIGGKTVPEARSLWAIKFRRVLRYWDSLEMIENLRLKNGYLWNSFFYLHLHRGARTPCLKKNLT